jgi:NTE family protein
MKIHLSLAIALLMACCNTRAQSENPDARHADTSTLSRARIGLVLSGGGARGAAHLGVIKVLEELRVPVDFIAATSMGAIVGASYASGLSSMEMQHEIEQLNTAALFRDEPPRSDIPLQRKRDDGSNFIGPEFGVSDEGSLRLSKGAVSGVAIETALRRLTRRQNGTDFDELSIPFRAVASDLETGEMVVLRSGSLAEAARASSAIPGAVRPIEIDGRYLVDGGLTRNLPVDVVRTMGADVVIAVNIGTPLLKRNEITSLVSVSEQMLHILTEVNVRQSLAELKPADVLITPDLRDLSIASFDRLGDAVLIGEKAAYSMKQQLERLSLPADEYARWQLARKRDERNRSLVIDEIRIEGLARVNPDVVRESMHVKPGMTLQREQIEADVRRIYGRGDFESINYQLVEEGARNVIVIDANEKAWGPNYLRVGLGLSSDFEGNAVFDLLATYRRTWLNSFGAEWRTDLQIGRNDTLATEWYQPLTSEQRWFIAPRAALYRRPIDVYNVEGDRTARLAREETMAGLDVGLRLSTIGEARLGAQRGRLRLSVDTLGELPASADLSDRQTGGVRARLRIDTLDNLRLPQSGYLVDVDMLASRSAFGASNSYNRVEAEFTTAFSSHDHALLFGLHGGGPVGGTSIPVYDQFTEGGFLQLSGYKMGQLYGERMMIGRAIYTYRVSNRSLLDGAYVGMSYELGRIGQSVLGLDRAPLRRSNALFLAFDSPVGPMYIAYGRANSHTQAAYFFLGRP